MTKDAMKRHDRALELARLAMHYCSFEGASIGAWRDAVEEICQLCNVPAPEDKVAWVSGGKASDADVTDWTRQFGVV